MSYIPQLDISKTSKYFSSTILTAHPDSVLSTDATGTASWDPTNEPNKLLRLNGSALIDSAFLPSYVDDIIEVANYAALPVTGDAGKIYVTLSDNKTWRWSGSTYIYFLQDFYTKTEDNALLLAKADASNYGQNIKTGGIYANNIVEGTGETVSIGLPATKINMFKDIDMLGHDITNCNTISLKADITNYTQDVRTNGLFCNNIVEGTTETVAIGLTSSNVVIYKTLVMNNLNLQGVASMLSINVMSNGFFDSAGTQLKFLLSTADEMTMGVDLNANLHSIKNAVKLNNSYVVNYLATLGSYTNITVASNTFTQASSTGNSWRITKTSSGTDRHQHLLTNNAYTSPDGIYSNGTRKIVHVGRIVVASTTTITNFRLGFAMDSTLVNSSTMTTSTHFYNPLNFILLDIYGTNSLEILFNTNPSVTTAQTFNTSNVAVGDYIMVAINQPRARIELYWYNSSKTLLANGFYAFPSQLANVPLYPAIRILDVGDSIDILTSRDVDLSTFPLLANSYQNVYF